MTVGIAPMTLLAPDGAALNFREPPFRDHLPTPLYFRAARMQAHTTYPKHSHSWGEFVYSFSGVMEISLKDHHFLAPPQYGVWLPPEVEHRGLNRNEAYHCSLYVSQDLCSALPAATSALAITPLVRAMLEHLRLEDDTDGGSVEQQRFLQALVDQLTMAPRVGTYLPWSTDPLLQPILTERTLIRRSLRDLGMPFSEWKQRLRVIKAMPMLENGEMIDAIARKLGYSTASAFIAMYKRMTGVTPDDYRNSARSA
jgi:hypothetical protein